MVNLLLTYIHHIGLECTEGDGYRDPRMHGKLGERRGYGSRNSLHKLRLAIDLNLFKDGQYLKLTEEYKLAGEFWESIGGSWGGRFSTPDGNHFSLEHNGMR